MAVNNKKQSKTKVTLTALLFAASQRTDVLWPRQFFWCFRLCRVLRRSVKRRQTLGLAQPALPFGFTDKRNVESI